MAIPFLLPQVTRIPIAGPNPYNTLVCVQAECYGDNQVVQAGKLSRWSISVPTSFKLAGFDQRVPPVFDHSTTAFISSIGPAEDDRWLHAVDAVTGAGFNPVDGTYFVNIDVAMSPGKAADGTCVGFGGGGAVGIVCFYFRTIQVTSFVLCYEPPIPGQPSSLPYKIPPSAAMAAPVPKVRGLDLANIVVNQIGIVASISMKLPKAQDNAETPGPCRSK